jgi:dTDP-4-amino-4,6-dideoxygalactose transaminase
MSLWPVYDDDMIEAVAAVLRSGRVNAWTGRDVAAFEDAYAEALGRKRAIALANGTVALELALRAFGVGPGDEVIVTPRSFVASAACVPLVGATPVFADVDPCSQNLTPATIEAAMTERTRAVIVVHLAGWPADMPEIMRLCRGRGVVVIEDCAQAHGAAIDGAPVGAFGDAAAFSFCQDKIITTGGEGGLLALDDETAWRAAWSFKDHGKSYAAVTNPDHPPGFRWLHHGFGTNWRMTGMQAALGLVQLARLPEWRAQRARNARILLDAMARMPGLRAPEPPDRLRHAYYRLYAFVEPEALREGWSRDRILRELAARGAPAMSGSCGEIYRETAFAQAGFAPPRRLPAARALAETSIAFHVDPTLEPAALQTVSDALGEVMAAAARTPAPTAAADAPAGRRSLAG